MGYSLPVPDPEPQYYEDYDYNNNGAGGGIGQGGNKNYDYDNYGSLNCEDSQCQQIYPEGEIGGGVAGGNKLNCKGSQCQQTFDGKDHSKFFSDSFWDRKRNGRNRRY